MRAFDLIPYVDFLSVAWKWFGHLYESIEDVWWKLEAKVNTRVVSCSYPKGGRKELIESAERFRIFLLALQHPDSETLKPKGH